MQCAILGGVGNGNKTCCAKSCGTCGGKDCGTKPGGKKQCCNGYIPSDQICNVGGTMAPCKFNGNETKTIRHFSYFLVNKKFEFLPMVIYLHI